MPEFKKEDEIKEITPEHVGVALKVYRVEKQDVYFKAYVRVLMLHEHLFWFEKRDRIGSSWVVSREAWPISGSNSYSYYPLSDAEQREKTTLLPEDIGKVFHVYSLDRGCHKHDRILKAIHVDDSQMWCAEWEADTKGITPGRWVRQKSILRNEPFEALFEEVEKLHWLITAGKE